jgi:hypothetical protein
MDTTKVKINLPYTKVRQIARAIERAAALTRHVEMDSSLQAYRQTGDRGQETGISPVARLPSPVRLSTEVTK